MNAAAWRIAPDDDAMTALCETDLQTFVEQAWPIVVPAEPYQDNWHIGAICEHLEALYRREIYNLLINVPPRFGKPLSIETLVLMGDGSRKRLADVVVGDQVIAHTGHACRVSAVHVQGILPVVRITFRSGRTTVSALDHPFLTPLGWVEAGKLSGKTCANVAAPQVGCVSVRGEDEFWLAGYLIGDGSLSGTNCALTAMNPAIRADFTWRALKMGWRVRETSKSLHLSGGALAWKRAAGLDNLTAYTKRVPRWVFTAEHRDIAAFLAGYFMTDGYVDTRGRPSASSVSEDLARDVQHLLLRFGIQSTMKRKLGAVGNRKVRQVGVRYVSWEVRTNTNDDAAKFAAIVPLFDYKAVRIRSVGKERSKFDRALLEDAVESVIPAGEAECRCLTVDHEGTFTADDVVVHNSVLGSVMFPAWNWIQDATYRMVYSSYSQRLSTRDSLATRRLLESSWYRQRWADRFVITTDQNEKTLFENDKKGFRLATSVGGVATGEGGDLVAVDDPHNVNEAESETVRQGVLDWWNITMPTRTGRAGRASRLVIMQRINEGDLSGDIITKGNYVHLCIPMEYESKFTKKAWNGWTDPRTEDGELAWKERFTEEVITATLRPPNMSSVAYAGQMQQRPAPAEGGMFKRGWWKYHRLAAEVLIAKADDKCWSWDMAFKDLDDSDYVAGLAWVRVGGDMYLLPHKVHERIGFSASKAAVKTCAAKYPGVHYKLVEDKANGTAVIDDLRHSVGGLVAIEPQGGKEARASVMQPYVEAGNIWLPDPMDAPWIEDYIEEFRVFPNGNNDDYVDASTQAIVWMLNRMVKGFAPIVTSFTRSTAMSDGAPRFRDPRYGDEPLEVPAGYSERGDMPRPPRRPTAEHNFEDNVHRTECRGCRVAWKRAHAPAPIKPVLVSV